MPEAIRAALERLEAAGYEAWLVGGCVRDRLMGAEPHDYDLTTSAEPSEVEAVFVLTPNYSHYEVTMDALRAGKHVFCEKPVTVNYELSAEMAKEADRLGLMLNIGVCNRFHRSVEMLKELNEQGRFGKLFILHLTMCRICRIETAGPRISNMGLDGSKFQFLHKAFSSFSAPFKFK